MSSLYDKDYLKLVDDKIDKIIGGYIRETEKELSKGHGIPKEVIQLCLLFYFEPFEQLDAELCGQDIELQETDKGVTIAKKLVVRGSPWETVYGKILIDPIKLKDMIIRWRIKCHPVFDAQYMSAGYRDIYFSVGIIAVHEVPEGKVNKYCFISTDYTYYAWTGRTHLREGRMNKGGHLEYNCETAQECTRVGQDAVRGYSLNPEKENFVEIELNLLEEKIEWKLNDEPYLKYFRAIDTSKQYNLALCLDMDHTVLEIVDFQIKHAI